MDQVVFETELGYCALACGDRGVSALTFGYCDPQEAIQALAERLKLRTFSQRQAPTPVLAGCNGSSHMDGLIQRIHDYFRGQPADFSDVEVDWSGLTAFHRRVSQACRALEWGETCSYGQLARAAGRPGAARAVGSVMARNRVPLIIPCHRVVASSGGLGGFSAPQGIVMKRRLLTMEQHASLPC